MHKMKKVKTKKKKKQNFVFNSPGKEKLEKTGNLYVVATPIGNMEDITLRAIKILNKVDNIVAEDTRRTAKLLQRYYISCPMISYHDRNKETKVNYIIEKLLTGSDVALVSDAGTPAISDPGFLLVKNARNMKINVVSIPGVSSVTSLISISGLATDRFTFYGFFPRKKNQGLELLELIRNRNETAIFFESPHRYLKTLRMIDDILPSHTIVVGRELTKVHEQVLTGTVKELLNSQESKTVCGEITIIIGKKSSRTPDDVSDVSRETIY